jgi:uncharacterized protein (TIGR02145 family)
MKNTILHQICPYFFLLLMGAGCGSKETDPSPTGTSYVLELKTDATSLKYENGNLQVAGSVTTKDNFTLISKGICYGTTTFPVITKDSVILSGTTFGSFTTSIPALQYKKTWYIRAFAVSRSGENKVDTSYGTQISFYGLHTMKALTATPRNSDSLVFSWQGLKLNTISGLTSVLSKGVCWGTTTNPVPSPGNFVLGGSADTTGFSGAATGLLPATIYFFRAFAVNGADTAYGENYAYSTSFRDSEQYLYTTIKIGNQLWMQQNLNTSRFSNGESLKATNSNLDWDTTTNASFAQVSATNSALGKFYNHYAITDARNLCPAGWHIPNRTEWDSLFNRLGGWQVAGLKLKSKNSWGSTIETQGTSSFNADPSGYKNEAGVVLQSDNLGYWWMKSASPSAIKMTNFDDEAFSGSATSGVGYTVRCLKD